MFNVYPHWLNDWLKAFFSLSREHNTTAICCVGQFEDKLRVSNLCQIWDRPACQKCCTVLSCSVFIIIV